MIPLLFVQLCITEFYLGRDQSQIRIKSEVGTIKHVEALQFFFLLGLISRIVFLNVKNLAFTAYSVRVCVCVGGGRGGGGGGSRQYNHTNINHDPAIGYSIRCVDCPQCWRVGQWLQMHFTLTTRVGIFCAK